jgi:3-deoxy-manno-octulosonate cytidylyltransferase (CMP-KDO synthetase)
MSTVGCFQIKGMRRLGSKVAIVIPARLASVRLPNKVLLEISGLPMIEHVRRRGLMNKYSVPVFVATGDDMLIDVVESFGGDCIKTYQDHTDGLSRVNEASTDLAFEHYIILQGDEILIVPSEIDRLIEMIFTRSGVQVWNQTTSLSLEEELTNVSIVKCFTNSSNNIYSIFRKSPLTCSNKEQMKLVLKICGLFAVSKNALNDICRKENSKLQSAESIEQLKFIEYGYSIKSLPTDNNFPSINIPEDIARIKEAIKTSPQQSRILNEVIAFSV